MPASPSAACLLALALLLTALPVGAARAAACDYSPAVQRFEQLLADRGLPGGALLLGTRQGLLLQQYRGSYAADTVVAIASASKLASAVRILQLADRGQLPLDDRVERWLAGFGAQRGAMTIEQLFAHTSGYGNDSADPLITDRGISLAAAVSQIECCRDLAPGYAVGGQFAYGGVSMHVAGRIAELATGVDWEQGWQDGIGAPLGITRIDWQGLGPTTNYMIAGGARASLRDYGALLHVLLNGGWANGHRLLSRDAVFELWRDRIGSLAVIDPPPTAQPPVRYSLGAWIVERESGRPPLIHSLGAFGFMPWIDFEAGLFGVFMIRALPGINLQAYPVYLQMIEDLRIATAAGCPEFERFPGIFQADFEGRGAP
ncbi:serine hydrolase domain-containing protein [Pseudomarimonas salicorniae]|uniref:Beta-lactamase family protein n=1 Tax=Pseudomarimonas salicorniae TaxID=2933270 RepID=A0ABT0GF53_9GAMM|nr:serine hydrolase domain-containing protein [Lysobacter sp. CAU 1642]MCK7592662.1 beta-lactamase family protein [Lysobacter sp. CAU 1642]